MEILVSNNIVSVSKENTRQRKNIKRIGSTKSIFDFCFGYTYSPAQFIIFRRILSFLAQGEAFDLDVPPDQRVESRVLGQRIC